MLSIVVLTTILGWSGAIQGANHSAYVNDHEYIERLNSAPDATWVAASQEFFEGLTVEDAQMLLGAKLSHISRHLNKTRPDSYYASMATDDLPTDFDSRTQWPDLIHPIRNQLQCGSCWAFSASEVLSDRVAIAEGKPSPVLSAEDMVSCDETDHGCEGGTLPDAWKYLTDTGIVTDDCMPYTAGSGRAPACTDQCVDSESFVRTKAVSAYAIDGPVNMQKDIMTSGPIQVGFTVYMGFMLYRHGVYHKHVWEVAPQGGHAVKVIGWGVARGLFGKPVEYWTVANSWGPAWGEKGFFRILRGKNACGIEDMGPPYAGLAKASGEDLIVV